MLKHKTYESALRMDVGELTSRDFSEHVGRDAKVVLSCLKQTCWESLEFLTLSEASQW